MLVGGVPAPVVRKDWFAALRARMQGPGGYYNMGNLLVLGVGLSLTHGSVAGFFAGSQSAVAMTLASLVFFWGGEVYHRAWARGAPPDAGLNRRGDVLSGIGALILGVGLLMLGQPWLAAFSGGLHAAGKFGSAWHGAGPVSFVPWARRWPDPFRLAVVVSRGPAVAAAVVGLFGGGAEAMATLGLLVSYGLWLRADLMLLRGA